MAPKRLANFQAIDAPHYSHLEPSWANGFQKSWLQCCTDLQHPKCRSKIVASSTAAADDDDATDDATDAADDDATDDATDAADDATDAADDAAPGAAPLLLLRLLKTT